MGMVPLCSISALRRTIVSGPARAGEFQASFASPARLFFSRVPRIAMVTSSICRRSADGRAERVVAVPRVDRGDGPPVFGSVYNEVYSMYPRVYFNVRNVNDPGEVRG